MNAAPEITEYTDTVKISTKNTFISNFFFPLPWEDNTREKGKVDKICLKMLIADASVSES